MTWIIIAIAAIIVLWFFFTYNGFITGRNRSEEAWADIEVQLKRRYDLIPNLVNAVKGYAAHESTAFEKVSEARTRAMTSQGTPASAQAEGELSGTLKSLFAIAEAYPELKANTNFLSLQTELSDTENKIQAARRFYNGVVRDYNTSLDRSPSNIVGHMFGFQKKNYFDLADNDAAQQPVTVQF
jgi:LemA protein